MQNESSHCLCKCGHFRFRCWAPGFILNSVEHEIYPANKNQNIINFNFLPCGTELSVKLILLIDIKMPTVEHKKDFWPCCLVFFTKLISRFHFKPQVSDTVYKPTFHQAQTLPLS